MDAIIIIAIWAAFSAAVFLLSVFVSVLIEEILELSRRPKNEHRRKHKK